MVAMIAQVVEGELDWAELFFIVAMVLFIVDALVRITQPAKAGWAAILTVLGFACMAFGFVLW